MKHAGEEALDKLADLLVQISQHQALREKKRGVFYRKSRAFLHFHEDRDLLYADLQMQISKVVRAGKGFLLIAERTGTISSLG
jgi:hypothetical protein